ncbi:MAG: dockerin type I domain-containing protein [Gammaproteobacteria bacterium]
MVANPTQCDSDGDGYGNHCDGDFNNNGATNSQDYLLFRQQLGQPSVAPNYNQADLNCNGVVNGQDYLLFRARLGVPSGPSGLVP